MAQITVIQNGKSGLIFHIDKTASAGRDSCNDIHVPDQRASRRHIMIENVKGYFILKDLGSRNGTKVNGIKVKQCELNSGDRITLGNTQLVFVDELPLSKRNSLTQDDTDNTDDMQITRLYGIGLNELIRKLNSRVRKPDTNGRLEKMIAFASSSLPVESGSIVFQDIQELLHNLFRIDRSYILMPEQNSSDMKPEAVRITRKSEKEPDFKAEIFRETFLNGYSLLFPSDTAGQKSDLTDHESHRSAIAVPVFSASKIIGMIYVDCQGANLYSETDLILFTIIGHLSGAKISTWYSFKKLQTRSLSSLLALTKLAQVNGSASDHEKTLRIATRSLILCEAMGLPDDQCELITTAAILAVFMNKSLSRLDITETLPEDVHERDDPETGIDPLKHVEAFSELQDISRILRHRNDNYSGSGTEYLLNGSAIPLGSRVLKALFYLDEHAVKDQELTDHLKMISGSILDPVIVKMLIHLTGHPAIFNKLPDLFHHTQEDTDS